AIQVFFATIAGVWAYRKDGFLHKKLIVAMGSAILVGSFIGGYGSDFMSDGGINFVYAILATIAAVMMFVPRKGVAEKPVEEVDFNVMLAIVSALIVGIGSGIVGAAGAFL